MSKVTSSSSPEYQDGSTTKDNTPLGIYIIAAVSGIGSLLAIFGGLVLLGGGQLLFGLFSTALGGFSLYVLLGLVRLEYWAWVLTLLVYGLSAIRSLIQFDILGLPISLIIIVYLLTKSDYYER